MTPLNLVAILNVVSEKLKIAVPAPQGIPIYTKLPNVLEQISGFKVPFKISKILDGETDYELDGFSNK